MRVDLDEALRSYVDRPVPLGMEARILARCRRRSWQWQILGLVAAGLSCLVWFWPAKKAEIPLPMHSVKIADAGQKPGDRAEPPPHRRHKSSGVNALWRFAQEHPEAAMQLTVEYQLTPIAPIQIEPIVIKELEIN
jgi:hypothetical protein